MVNPKTISRLLPVAFAIALFFLVLGAKWAVFDRFGSDLPNWDQWDAEGLNLLAPWFEHDHFTQHLFTPHNEHRVVMTKLQNLAVTLAAGQWDARVEIVFNAALHSALAVACWLVGRRWLRQRTGDRGQETGHRGKTPRDGFPSLPSPVSCLLNQAAWFLVVALLFGLPIAWQNVIGGFHSQQYWLLGLSFAAMVALPFARPWRLGWWAAALAAALALLTMGSGFLASVLIFAAVAWRWLRGDTTARDAWPTLTVTAALVVVGLLTRVEVDYHAHMKAKTVHDFVFCSMHNLQWPVPRGDAWWAALVLWLPWAIVAWRALRERGPVARVAQPIAALGGWVVLQVLATAYARGANGDFPASRYMDTLAFGMMANALALGWLCSGTVSRLASIARAALGAAWLAVLAVGLWQVTPLATVDGLPDTKRYFHNAEAYVKAYLVTNDRADLLHDDIPYPGADSFIERVGRPSLRTLMPVSVRPPLPLAAGGPAGVFQENRVLLRNLDEHSPRRGLSPATAPLASHPTWGSFGERGVAATGEWRSAPLTAPLGGWLKFETAGQLGEPGVSLALCDANTGALLAAVRPTKVPGDAWRAAYVRAPRGPFMVIARDESATRWLAFSAPVEMSNLSHAAWVLVKNGQLIATCAAIACALLGLAALLAGGARPEPPSHQSRSPAPAR